MNVQNPAEAMQAFRHLEAGDTRMRAIRAAITEAELEKNLTSAIALHYALIKESVFSGDRYQALVDFPQYLALVHNHPELAAMYSYDTLWMFKWIVEAATEFYQIEKKQVLQWFSEFRRELQRQGYSLKPFYEKRAIFYSYCDRAKLRLDYEDFLRAPRDEMSDGLADEYNTIVRWELELGSREKAMKTADEIFRRNMRSDEIPASTYGYLLRNAMQRDDMQTAAEYAEKMRPLCTGVRFRLEQIGLLLCYDALTDPARGLAFYRQNLRLREGSRNPLLCFWFDLGAAKLLQQAAEQGLTEDPDALRTEAEKLHAACKELAALFDARNGSDYFTSQCI